MGTTFFKMLLALFLLSACAPTSTRIPGSVSSPVSSIVGALPVPYANNAVALSIDEGRATAWSFNGLRTGKTWQDTSREAYSCDLGTGICETASGPPVDEGRLASVAVTLGNKIYLFGGYTVAEDGGEVSTPEVFAFDPRTGVYDRLPDMPTPVDDMVALVHQDRYIYLISGWHNEGNVSLVQVYDSAEQRWFEATPYPGAPVFGHAGGGVDGKVVIADGVAVTAVVAGKRQFGPVDEAWFGEIDDNDPSLIAWTRLPPHPNGPLYRMAAVGDRLHQRIVFYGGADNPYNYDGIGYDGVPANASDLLFAYDLGSGQWITLGRTGKPSMDHRGLIVFDEAYWTLGGMNDQREVTGELVRIDIED